MALCACQDPCEHKWRLNARPVFMLSRHFSCNIIHIWSASFWPSSLYL